jgi:hypothetical protein
MNRLILRKQGFSTVDCGFEGRCDRFQKDLRQPRGQSEIRNTKNPYMKLCVAFFYACLNLFG